MNKSIYFLLLLIVTSCGPAWHLQQSKKHIAIAIAKGGKVVQDTIYKEVEKRIPVPGDTVYVTISPEIDKDTFDATMEEYDSTQELTVLLENDLASGSTLDREKTMKLLKAANAENTRLLKRLAQGFSKDSTYSFQTDSIMTIWVSTKNGLVSAVGYDRKRTELTWKEKIPIYIDQKVKAGFNVMELIGVGVFGVVLGALVLGIIIVVRGENEDHV